MVIDRFTLAQNYIYLNGKPLSLQDYRLLRNIYNWPAFEAQETVLVAGRQVSKTTTLCNCVVLDSCLEPYFKTLYVTPLKEQTSKFNNLYLKPTLEGSPVLKDFFLNKESINNVSSKSLTNGSIINLSYSLYDVERLRGIPADRVVLDEAQNMLYDNIPIILETLGSPTSKKLKLYAGTPKTTDNLLEYFWQKSCQFEWGMKCSCGVWNFPIKDQVYAMIKPEGLCCRKCGKLLNIHDGRWVAFNPSRKSVTVGYHIPQVIIPNNVEVKTNWNDLLRKQIEYPKVKFANEVLGLSMDLGGKIITKEELQACCVLPSLSSLKTTFTNQGCMYIGAGVDWGVTAETSYTVVVIGGITPEGVLKIFFARKYSMTDPLVQIEDIVSLCNTYRVICAGCDYGVGHTNNTLMRQKLGASRIVEIQYVTSNTLARWDPKDNCLMLNRTTSLELLLMHLKQKKILLPSYTEMEPFCADILGIYEDTIEGRSGSIKVFAHPPSVPDDFAHALNYLKITLQRCLGELIAF